MAKILRRLSFKERRDIHRAYFNPGDNVKSTSELAREYGVPVATVWNILNGKVKMTKNHRLDKGVKRRRIPMDNKNYNPAELINAGWNVRQHIENQSLMILEQLPKARINLIDRTKIIADISRMERQRKEQEIEAHIKRTDAQVIARIVRRFMPQATDADVIKIFREELDRWKSEN